jgi:hypothetical protein
MIMQAYTIEINMYDDNWEPRFVFNARNDQEAGDKLNRWNRHHSFSDCDTRIRPATQNEAINWLHNEYIDFLR